MDRERILVTTDLSEQSHKIIDKAISFALSYNKWLEVLHVVEPALFSLGLKADNKSIANEERLQFISEKIKKGLGRQIDRMNVHTQLGNISDTIKAYAIEKRAGLIIIGDSERKGGIMEMLLGSVAHQIISDSPVSVLIAKTTHGADYKTIYIPTDFSDRSLNMVGALTSVFSGAEFVLEHLYEMPTELQLAYYDLDSAYLTHFGNAVKFSAEDNMKSFVQSLKDKYKHASNTTVKTSVVSGHINGEQFVSNAMRFNADMIALYAASSRHSRTFAVVQNAQIDVLIHK
jgi:universal stress protein A